MSINLTQAFIQRLNREIAALQQESMSVQKKKEQALSKLKQLQRHTKISASPSDLNNTLSRINQLSKEIAELNSSHPVLLKQLAAKTAALQEQLSKTRSTESPDN